MKFTAEAAALYAAAMGHAAPKNAPIPVLSGIVVEAIGKRVVMRSTDYVATVQSETDSVVDVLDEGEICVNYAKFAGTLSGLSGAVTVAVREGQMSISCRGRRGTYRLDTMLAEEHPTRPFEWPGTPILVPERLPQAIADVRYAASKQDVRRYLQGVALVDGFAVATDGHRLAYAALGEGTEGLPAVIIDREGVPVLLDVLQRKGAEFQIERGEGAHARAVHAHQGGRFVTAQALDHSFPHWRNALKSGDPIGEIEIDVSALRAALSRFHLLAAGSLNEVCVRLVASRDGLQLSSAKRLSIDEVLPPTDDCSVLWEGDPSGEVLFDGRYLTALLQQGRGELVWGVNAPEEPQEFRFVGSDTRHIIMPWRAQ